MRVNWYILSMIFFWHYQMLKYVLEIARFFWLSYTNEGIKNLQGNIAVGFASSAISWICVIRGFQKYHTKEIVDIQNLGAPKTKKQLRAILGTTGFWRQWISAYSEMMKCLTNLNRNTEPEYMKLKPEHCVAWNRLKEVILSVLA